MRWYLPDGLQFVIFKSWNALPHSEELLLFLTKYKVLDRRTNDFFNLMFEIFQAFFSPHLILVLCGFNRMCSEQAKTFPALEELLCSKSPSFLSFWLSSSTAKWHMPSFAGAISALIKLNTNQHGGPGLLFLFALHIPIKSVSLFLPISVLLWFMGYWNPAVNDNFVWTWITFDF